MIYVAEVPKTQEFVSFDRFNHGGETHVWSVGKDDFVSAAGWHTAGRMDAFTDFDSAVGALRAGSGLEKVFVFESEADLDAALKQPNLWIADDQQAQENDFAHFLSQQQLMDQARDLLHVELARFRNPPQPIFIDEDGAAYFG